MTKPISTGKERRIYRTAWRAWDVVPMENALRLHSLTATWLPNAKQVAKCWKKRKHSSPAWSCTCGIYGAFRKEMLIRNSLVIGRCAFWGKTIVHQYGLRSQYAYPLSLALGNYRARRCLICRKDLGRDHYYMWSKYDNDKEWMPCCNNCQKALSQLGYLYTVSAQSLLRELLNTYGCDLEVTYDKNRQKDKEGNLQP